MAGDPDRTVPLEKAAAAVGLTPRSLGRYRKAGAPCSPGRGKAVLFNLDELRAWMRANGRDGGAGGSPEERADEPVAAPVIPAAPPGPTPREKLQEVRARKEQLAVERQELELAQRRAEVVTLDEARRLVRAYFAEAKARLAGWPARVAARLEGLAYDARLGALEDELGALVDQLGSVPA